MLVLGEGFGGEVWGLDSVGEGICLCSCVFGYRCGRGGLIRVDRGVWLSWTICKVICLGGGYRE